MRLIFVLALVFGSSAAFAQAGSDCGEQSRMAAQNCDQRFGGQQGPDASDFGTGAGINGGGGSQAAGLYKMREKIGQQVNSCNQTDRQVCVDKCNAALRDAQGKNNQALIGKIKENMGTCSERIDRKVAAAQAEQARFTDLAAGSNASAGGGCAEGETCGTRDPNVQLANDSRTCPQGMFWSYRWNQCAGIGAFSPSDMIPQTMKQKMDASR